MGVEDPCCGRSSHWEHSMVEESSLQVRKIMMYPTSVNRNENGYFDNLFFSVYLVIFVYIYLTDVKCEKIA